MQYITLPVDIRIGNRVYSVARNWPVGAGFTLPNEVMASAMTTQVLAALSTCVFAEIMKQLEAMPEVPAESPDSLPTAT